MRGDEKASVVEHLANMHAPLRDPRAHIRLIRFDPKETGDSILVSLETWDLQCAPPYNAISYAWGEPSERHAIKINGATMPVSKNCFHALRQTSLHFPSNHVWIDVISSDQLDLDGKSARLP